MFDYHDTIGKIKEDFENGFITLADARYKMSVADIKQSKEVIRHNQELRDSTKFMKMYERNKRFN